MSFKSNIICQLFLLLILSSISNAAQEIKIIYTGDTSGRVLPCG